jgi:hypothetical protein
MCEIKHCQRAGCEKHIPENRTDDFCSNSCKKSDQVMRFVALKDAYQELPLANSMLMTDAIPKKKRKICALDGCEKPVSQRGSRAKFCSVEHFIEYKTRKRFCEEKSCGKKFHPYRASMKYCCRACYVKAVGVERFCTNTTCGKKLKSSNQEKFCSQACYREHRFGDIKKFETCQATGCDNKLTDRRSTRKYCSQPCYDAARQEKKNTLGQTKLLKRKEWKYPRRFIKTENGWKLLSILTWETHNGPVPQYHFIDFIDGDSFNDQDINNLKLVSCIDNLLTKRAKSKEEAITSPVSGEMFSVGESVL